MCSTNSANKNNTNNNDNNKNGTNKNTRTYLPKNIHQTNFTLTNNTLYIIEHMDAPNLFVEPYNTTPS
jgi:hypothetical protein